MLSKCIFPLGFNCRRFHNHSSSCRENLYADPKTTLKYLDMFDQDTLDKVNDVIL